MSSPSSEQLAAPANIEQSENGSSLHSFILFAFSMGIYTLAYFGTLYVYLARQTSQRRIVITTITTIYILNVILFAFQWWLIQWEFIINGQTQDSVFIAYRVVPEWINLIIYITSVLTIVLADGLLIWRCYYVWNRSIRILVMLLLLWTAEFGLSVSSVAFQGVVGTRATHQLALVADNLVSAQYFLAFFTSVITTFLIAYRIHSVSRQSIDIGISSGRRFKHILDIVVQSSVVYSLTLLLLALNFVLPEVGGNGSNTRGFALVNYSSVLGFVISGLAPTVMVARVALLAIDNTESSIAPRLSALDFRGNPTAHSDTVQKLESNIATDSSNGGNVMTETREKYDVGALET